MTETVIKDAVYAETKETAKKLVHALKILLATFQTEDEDLINVNCDYAAEKAKAFLEAQEGRNDYGRKENSLSSNA